MQTLNKKYGNCKVFSPTDVLMFLCNPAKIRWYLKRNLAVPIEDPDGLAIKLLFEPKGLGYFDDSDDYFYKPKENKCVCCGTADYSVLTKHHIVPYWYRKWMPDIYKNHNSYDVVMLCRICHDKYEIEAAKLKIDLFIRYQIELKGACKFKVFEIKGYAGTMLQHFDKLPESKFDIMSDAIEEYLGRPWLDQDLEKLSNLKIEEDKNYFNPAKLLVDKIIDLDEFIKMWRQHFIDNLNPQFMPDGWTVNRDVIRKSKIA
jgi:hypothetical protein